MARIARWIGWTVFGLLVLVLLTAAAATLWLRTSLPQLEGERPLAGLKAPVTVSRDTYGVPHIRAENIQDAHRALGFLHAQDRLFQMEMTRRVARGRLAEIAGGSVVNIDKRMRTFGLAALAEADAAAMPADVRAVFEAYAGGVNDFLASHSGSLPPEFMLFPDAVEPWRPADSLLWLKLMSLRLTADWSDELQRAALADVLTPAQIAELYPELEGPITLGALPGAEAIRHALDRAAVVQEEAGSNVWIYTGSRTDTGKPILANDPHLGFSVPNVWYLARIETPEGVLAGATAPAFPLLVIGHNGKVAWGLTNAYGDTSDVFVERIAPGDPAQYLTPDGPRPFEMRPETITVRFGDAETITVRSTRHGPVISDQPGSAASVPLAEDKVLALAHTGLLPGDGSPEALFRVQRVSSAAEAVAAMRPIQAPQQNIVFADVAGATALISPALVPKRRVPSNPLPAPGWDGSHDWDGFIPFEELPQVQNPASGRLVNANNRLVGPDYPHDLGHAWSSPLRAERIEAALDQVEPHTIAHSLAVQTDATSPAAQQLLALVDWQAIGDALPPDLQQAMRGWDGAMRRDRPEPLMFYAWLRALVHTLYADELGERFSVVNSDDAARVLHALTTARQWCDDVASPEVEDCNAAIARAFREAFADLTERYGHDWQDWRWGEAHQARFRHMLFGFFPVLKDIFDVWTPHDGGRHTPNAGIVSFDEANLYNQVHGASLRTVYDLADLDRSRFVQAVGQSGNIFSPHYADMLPLWAAGETLSLAPLRAGDAIRTLRLVPQP